MLPPLGMAEATVAAAAAGAVNSVSGGGTLITFPLLLALNISSKTANATSTVALLPGVIAAMWGYRREIKESREWAPLMLVPSFLGGLMGAILLLLTPLKAFDKIAPLLVLLATVLFMAHTAIARRLHTADKNEPAAISYRSMPKGRLAAYFLFQFFVALYGGYFGAGIGILMLASLGIMGFQDIHRMNGLKSWGALCINGIAVLVFWQQHLIDWNVGICMALGSIAGGYLGAHYARRTGQVLVRRIIITVGFLATAFLLFRKF